MELRDMTADRWGVYWNALDIDLSIESLEHPERFPEKISVDAWLRARNRRAAQMLGNIRSARKAAASRHNGSKGGQTAQEKRSCPRVSGLDVQIDGASKAIAARPAELNVFWTRPFPAL